MKLIDIAKILRSKNAGPLYITFDLMFNERADMQKVLDSISKEAVAEAYDVNKDDITIIPYEIVNSIKVTFPRKIISGSVYDDDIYGCQKHIPLGNIEI